MKRWQNQFEQITDHVVTSFLILQARKSTSVELNCRLSLSELMQGTFVDSSAEGLPPKTIGRVLILAFSMLLT